MSRKKDLTGMRFGKLIALNPTDQRKNGYTVWRCVCDCGNLVYVPSRYLKNGWVVSCDSPECKEKKTKIEDLTGQRFGRLTVISRAENVNDPRKRTFWNCSCDCGGKIVAPTNQLKAGYRKSCGCLSRPPIKDWVGRQFGHLTVISYDGKREGKHYWKCKCECGTEVNVCQSSLQNGHTTSCGCRNTPFAARILIDGTSIDALRSAVRYKNIAKNNSSGIRGVYQNRRTGRWCAQITFKGKTKYLGSYESIADARKARERGEEIFEEFLEAYESRNPQEASGI